MALISELIDFGKIAKDVAQNKTGNNYQYLEATAKLFKKAKAISASANKYTVVYPVLISTKISDIKTALAITKQIELECARFIIMAAGLKPIIGGTGNEINNQINSIFTEESFKGIPFQIKHATDEEFYSVENYLESIRNVVPEANFRKQSRFINSTEMQEVDTDKDPGETLDDTILSEDEKEFARQKMGIDPDKTVDENGKPLNDDEKKDIQKKVKEYYVEYVEKNGGYKSDYDKTLSEITKEGPSIVKLKFFLKDQGTTIEIPLAVKAVLKYVDSSDCVDLLKRSKTFSSKFMTLVKLISGELCFKEWLLQLDEAKKDVEREKEMGKVPWYRNLIGGKNRWKTKNAIDAFKMHNEFVKGKGKEDMPMCTIIFDEDEFSDATRVRLSTVLNNRKYINSILDEYMLLCLGIVDHVNDILYLFFAGESEYRTIDILKAGQKGGASSGTDVSGKLIQMLGKSFDIMNRR